MSAKGPAPKTCSDCLYYRQHYVHFCGDYHKIPYGHCTKPRLRKRMSDSPACQRFDPTTPREELPREPKTKSPNS